MNSTSPPTGVHARPVAMPISVIFSALSRTNVAWPRYFPRSFAAKPAFRRTVADHDFARGLAGEGGDLALELAHAGLAGVFADKFAQGGVGKFDVVASSGHVPRSGGDEVAPGNLEFFRFGVAGQLDDFQPVAQRGMHRVQPVGGGDEQHMRQIERQIQDNGR
jgi:hypothetical protein